MSQVKVTTEMILDEKPQAKTHKHKDNIDYGRGKQGRTPVSWSPSVGLSKREYPYSDTRSGTNNSYAASDTRSTRA